MRWRQFQHDVFTHAHADAHSYSNAYTSANSNAITLANTQCIAHAYARTSNLVAADKFASGAAGAGASTAGGFAFSAHHFQSGQWRNSKFSSQCCSHCYAFESDFRDAGLR